MLPRSEQVKQDVVLGTDPHEPPHVVKVILEYIVAVNSCKPCCRSQHACQHRDGCGLARTVVAQKSEDLTFIHANINTVNSPKTVSKCLSQVLYL